MEELDNILRKYTAEVPNALKAAAFVAVNDRGETIYSKAVGNRELDAPEDTPMQLDSVHFMASLTKLMTTVSCMIAVEQGLISLDTNVREIVPELKDLDLLVGFEESEQVPRVPILKKVIAPITLRQLLSHTSGFTYDRLHPGIIEWSQYNKRSDHTFCGSMKGYTHPLIFEPGCGWSYGAGMDWAGRTVEVASGLTLEEFMKKNLWTKLEMHDTTFRPELKPDFSARRMQMAWRNRATGELSVGKVPLASPAQDCCGGVGLYSTPNDCAKVLKAVLSGGGAILKKSSVDEMLNSQLMDSKYFLSAIHGPGKGHLAQTWPDGAPGTFGLSSSINLEDFPGRRSKHSANWSGMPGIHAWIDRESGLAGLLTTQLLPPGDPMVTECLLGLETALYKNLRSRS